MRHLVDELKARADEQIAIMRDAALRARDTHARAELMRHMLMTANHVKAKPAAEAVAFIVDHWLEAWGLSATRGRTSGRWKRSRRHFTRTR